MVIKTGRFGEFLSCTGYPGCKNARPVPLGVPCPQCGGDLIEIRPRKKGGRTFYGCSNFSAAQKCDFKLWARPVPEPCPQCGAKFLDARRAGKKPMLVCATKDCGYKVELPRGRAEAAGDEVASTRRTASRRDRASGVGARADRRAAHEEERCEAAATRAPAARRTAN